MAYRDKWQRREGENWVEMHLAPADKVYTPQMFERVDCFDSERATT